MKRTLLITTIFAGLLLTSVALAQVTVQEVNPDDLNIGEWYEMENRAANAFIIVYSIGFIIGVAMIIIGIVKIIKWKKRIDPNNPASVQLVRSKKILFTVLTIIGALVTLFFLFQILIIIFLSGAFL